MRSNTGTITGIIVHEWFQRSWGKCIHSEDSSKVGEEQNRSGKGSLVARKKTTSKAATAVVAAMAAVVAAMAAVAAHGIRIRAQKWIRMMNEACQYRYTKDFPNYSSI